MNNIAIDVFNHFGYKTQIKKINEECYELIEAITEYETEGKNLSQKEHIAEEIADVEFLLKQFKEAYKLENELIDKIILEKAKRTSERIKNRFYD